MKFKSPANSKSSNTGTKAWVVNIRELGLGPVLAEQHVSIVGDGTEHRQTEPHAALEHDRRHVGDVLKLNIK